MSDRRTSKGYNAMSSQDSFITAVHDAVARATTTPGAMFGPRKVFISAVWDALPPSAAKGLDLSGFKRRLLDARRSGKVSLARADLVAAMDPDLVRRSETHDDGAEFHFIVRDADQHLSRGAMVDTGCVLGRSSQDGEEVTSL